MKRFNDDFKSKLYETIEDIENNSLVEIVSIIKSQSGLYRDISLWVASISLFSVSSWMMFSRIVFSVWLIWLIPILTFIIVYLLTEIVKPWKHLFVKKKRMKRNVEIYGRAIFQKGGIRFTNERIGVLFYLSFFEKQVLILPDRGAFTAVPDEEWQKMNERFLTVFYGKNPADAFISELKKCKEIFAKYILPVENDINELPDDLEVNF
ncbi:MAG: hypothetical protein L3J56_09035 [Bacteroidales bacterium]|nr:hypothetical protein [Bacteroidales bacterium]